MKRDYLESLGLEKEIIDSIMAEHGKTVQAVKTSLDETEAIVEDLKGQLSQRDEDLKELKDKSASVEELQAKITDYEAKYLEQQEEHETTVSKIRKQSEIKLGVTQAGARNLKAVMALLDDDSIELAEDGIKGLSEQLDSLKESDPYLFEPAKEPSGQAVNPANPTRTDKSGTNAFKKAVEKYTNR